MARAIVHVCQACQGDLRLVRGGRRDGDYWKCDACGARWIYGREGWTRIEEVTVHGTTSQRRGSR